VCVIVAAGAALPPISKRAFAAIAVVVEINMPLVAITTPGLFVLVTAME
jgi:hypothetical protein